jgi:hypothetical protein
MQSKLNSSTVVAFAIRCCGNVLIQRRGRYAKTICNLRHTNVGVGERRLSASAPAPISVSLKSHGFSAKSRFVKILDFSPFASLVIGHALVVDGG